MLTSEPQSAPEPKTVGVLSLPGDGGLVPCGVGVAGAEESVPTISALEQVADWPSGLVIVIEAKPVVAAEVSSSSVRWVGSSTVTLFTTTPLLTSAEMCS